ncbi:MAG: hypothetical protein CVT84_02050 [Alphaproteobacteria bacterium HGW-Alphaproteobacteria-6]|nr:MAG: hypothetical protein CVT84_02050 [Alphaproteobacteria bacterium HGW-Alphaproteobacteria-6]
MTARRGPDPARLAGLARIAALRKDAALAELARAGDARAVLLARLATLDALAEAGHATVRSAEDVTTLALCDARAGAIGAERGQVNLALARLTAAWLEARDRAALALGRDDVLRSLARKSADLAAVVRARRNG